MREGLVWRSRGRTRMVGGNGFVIDDIGVGNGDEEG